MVERGYRWLEWGEGRAGRGRCVIYADELRADDDQEDMTTTRDAALQHHRRVAVLARAVRCRSGGRAVAESDAIMSERDGLTGPVGRACMSMTSRPHDHHHLPAS